MAQPIAPSVTSLGPRGWTAGPCLSVFGCTDPFFRPTINFKSGTVEFDQKFNLRGGNNFRHGRHRGGVSGGIVYYPYPYPYPVAVASDEADEQYQQYQQDQPEQQDGQGLTVFDRRPAVRPAPNPIRSESDSRYGENYLDQRDRRASAQEPAEPSGTHQEMSSTSRELLPVVIVFKDGREQEIGNYAIVGDTLYDLGAFVAHKIKLADLDLKQTIEKNEERGVEFTLPASYKPEA